MPLPPKYAWLPKVDGLPLMVQQALKLYGVHEGVGAADNPTILAWAAEVGLQHQYTADSIAWCGLFMALVAHRAEKPVPADPLWALNWSNFGVPAGQPALGDVLVFVRPGGGHVGLYIGEDTGPTAAYHVLGGNESDQVMITRIDKHRLHAARRPAYHVPPAGVKPHILAASGALSTNEG